MLQILYFYLEVITALDEERMLVEYDCRIQSPNVWWGGGGGGSVGAAEIVVDYSGFCLEKISGEK